MSQKPNCPHVISGKQSICPKHTRIPKRGTQGTKGTLKGRLNSGWVWRKIHTPKQTIPKMKRVSMETSWAKISTGNVPARIIQARTAVIEATIGVLVFALIFDMRLG